MKAARQFGIVLLLLVSYLTPAMACMVSNVSMSSEERACCRAMKNQCEQMGMPASHGCCQKTTKSAQGNAVATKTVTYHSIALTVLRLSSGGWLHLNPAVAGWGDQAHYSPPESPPSSIYILRI